MASPLSDSEDGIRLLQTPDHVEVELQQDREKLCCVFCKTDQPRDGRLLDCLHVACAGCIKDNIREKDNTMGVECQGCNCNFWTSAKIKFADLSDQLTKCRPILYDPREEVPDNESLAPQRKRRLPDLCYICDASNVKENATHRCTVAKCLQPLCNVHADRHSTTGLGKHHVVAKLDDTEQAFEQSARTPKCFVHPGEDITAHCDKCQAPICRECVNTDEHNDHGIHSLKSAANKLRVKLREVLEFETNEVIPNGKNVPSSLRKRVGGIVEEEKILEEEARQASSTLENFFSNLHDILEEKKKLLKEALGTKHEELLTPRQDDKRNVQERLRRHKMATDVGKYLAAKKNETTTDLSVIQLAPVLLTHIDEATGVAERAAASKMPDYLSIKMLSAANDAFVDKMVTISTTPAPDIQRLKVEGLPDIVTICHQIQITADLIDSRGRFISPDSPSQTSLSLEIEFPGGAGKQDLPTTISRSSSSSGWREDWLVLKANFTPEQEGDHQLIIKRAAAKRCVPFKVNDTLQFDSRNCSPGITLSANNRVAESNNSGKWEIACAERGCDAGKSSWNVRVADVDDFHAGVVQLPPDVHYSSRDGVFLKLPSYCWSCSGDARINDRVEKHCGMGKWKPDDVITFTLDCSRCTLECHCRRSGEKATIRDIDCTKPLYPAISM